MWIDTRNLFKSGRMPKKIFTGVTFHLDFGGPVGNLFLSDPSIGKVAAGQGTSGSAA
jgi:hypothetical protein